MEFYSNILSSFANSKKSENKPQNLDPQLIILDDAKSSLLFGKSITYDTFMDDYEKAHTDLPLTIRIKTYGGKLDTFLPIAKVLSNYPSKTILEVDRYSYSGGTILCLACDEIKLDSNSMLGSINPYMFIPVTSRQIIKAQETIGNSWLNLIFEYAIDMETCFLDQIRQMLLKQNYTETDIEELIEFFVYKFDHNVGIYYDDLPDIIKKKVVLRNTEYDNIDKELSEELNELS